MSAEALIGASLIVFLAFFVRGVWGFDSATIAIPLLAHFIALKFIGTLLIVSGLSLLAMTRKSAVPGVSEHNRRADCREGE